MLQKIKYNIIFKTTYSKEQEKTKITRNIQKEKGTKEMDCN
jgi:hypothetical protein